MNTSKLRRASLTGMLLGLLGCAVMSGCHTSYAVDVRNMTPQPVYAQIMEQFDESAVPRATQRLGPGDRAGLGPVIAREGRAFLIVDGSGNPFDPATAVKTPLAVGTTVVEVTQTGDQSTGPLQIRIIGGQPPAQEPLPPPPQPGK